MALINWSDKYCTGIPGIDYEHQKLIEQINSIYSLIDDQADRERVVDGLGDIYGNIAAHFALEERMMKEHGYDQYEAHRIDHERLLDDIRDIADEFEDRAALNEQEFKRKLGDWFQLHFKTHDSRLHKLVALRSHQRVGKSMMKAMIQGAKQMLLSRIN
ncbi:MAG: bacteriohemerythrin [Gammaproteobacteria bacterium]|nr:bacteriohemerythrin [Gammaproteobacteria bacterium]MDH3465656.1 bacteriohemerythrin [Gammaproteobacteria bacterium]